MEQVKRYKSSPAYKKWMEAKQQGGAWRHLHTHTHTHTHTRTVWLSNSEIHSHSQKFSPRNFRYATPIYVISLTFCEMRPSYRSAKVFSLKSFRYNNMVLGTFSACIYMYIYIYISDFCLVSIVTTLSIVAMAHYRPCTGAFLWGRHLHWHPQIDY